MPRDKVSHQGETTFTPLSGNRVRCNLCLARISRNQAEGHRRSHQPVRKPVYAPVHIYQTTRTDWLGGRTVSRFANCPNPKCQKQLKVNGPGQETCPHCQATFPVVE